MANKKETKPLSWHKRHLAEMIVYHERLQVSLLTDMRDVVHVQDEVFRIKNAINKAESKGRVELEIDYK